MAEALLEQPKMYDAWPATPLEPEDFPPAEPYQVEDGVPMESDWHRLAMNLLIESLWYYLRERNDYFVGGNMFVYYKSEHGPNNGFRGPDFFFVDGVPFDPPRRYWAVWNEGGKYPDVIIELTSPSTAKEDRTTKKTVYQDVFRTLEYYIFDPDTKALEGWRLGSRSQYQKIDPNDDGRLHCQKLDLWLGPWEGSVWGKSRTWLCFFDSDGNRLRLAHEYEEEQARLERERADLEKERADHLSTENDELRRRLAELEKH